MNLVLNRRVTSKEIIYQQFTISKSVDIAVAFLSDGGYSNLLPLLKSAIKGKVEIRLIVGLSMKFSSPTALKGLYDLSKKSKYFTLYLADIPGATFHSKYYYFDQGSKATVIIGSVNVTKGAWETNEELSVINTLKKSDKFIKDCQLYFEDLLSQEFVSEAIYLQIEQYENSYNRFKEVREKAEKETENIVFLNDKLLREYFTAYQADEHEQWALKDKKKRYKKAFKALNTIATERMNKQRFRDLYNHLVGASGYEKYWHSNGLYRGKNSVIDHHNKAISLIRFIMKNHMDLSPKELFELSMRKADEIPRLSYNVITEIFTTIDSKRFAVLNRNPLRSLRELGIEQKSKTSFTGWDYQQYCELIKYISRDIKKSDLQEVDHFLNYIYMELKSAE